MCVERGGGGWRSSLELSRWTEKKRVSERKNECKEEEEEEEEEGRRRRETEPRKSEMKQLDMTGSRRP